MFKRLRELINTVKMIPTIDTKLDKLQSSIEAMKKYPARNMWNFKHVPITDNELLATKLQFEARLRAKCETELSHCRSNLQEALIEYDKLLYQSTDRIASGDYTTMIVIITKLDVLKEMILHILFGQSDIFSFYLYFVDTPQLRNSLSDLPTIDVNKVFIISPSDVEESDDVTTDDTRYVKVIMYATRLIISSSDITVDISLNQRKTVLRVLYSIYTEKYHLYHLAGPVKIENEFDPVGEARKIIAEWSREK